jgi:hypothetical protein
MSFPVTQADADAIMVDLNQPVDEKTAMPPLRLELCQRNPRLCTIEFERDGGIKFMIASHFQLGGMFDNLRSRLIKVRGLFVRTRRDCGELTGACDLWLGDIPECPGLAFCSNNVSNVLIPDTDFLSSRGYQEFREHAFQTSLSDWTVRSDKVFWRGTVSGSPDRRPVADWRDIPRLAMCIRLRAEERFDVAITGHPGQIRDPKQVQEVLDSGLIQPRVTYHDFARHKALIDIDGNSSAWSCLMTKFLMGCTVIKIDSKFGFRQWYYDKLAPWKNFIPATEDFEDLPMIAEWITAHPDRAQEIAVAGSALARSITYEGAVSDAIPRIVEHVRLGTGWIAARG